MARIVARKIPLLLATVLAVSFITYFMVDLLPGDPCISILGPQGAIEGNLERCHEDMGFDDPLPIRYGRWLGDAATGDLGRSYVTNQPVIEAIKDRVPVTVEIGLLAIVMALLLAIPLGMFSAYRAGGIADRGITAGAFGLLSVPNFMVALFLIYVFAVKLDLLPATGWRRFSDNPAENLRAAIMPAVSLAIGELAVYTRLLRTDMIATLQEDFVLMARAKGLPTWRILLRHALRPSSLSLMTVVGLQIGGIIGGAVVVEQLFALPGVGRLLYESITQRDLILVQGVVLVVSVSFVVVNFLVDFLYSIVDPRIRHGSITARA